jgi:hypothetical protein
MIGKRAIKALITEFRHRKKRARSVSSAWWILTRIMSISRRPATIASTSSAFATGRQSSKSVQHAGGSSLHLKDKKIQMMKTYEKVTS